MYRKHCNEMEQAPAKTGIKTIDRISELPVVNTALTNVTDYYGKVKEKNVLLRTSCNLAELSLKTFAYAATPITSLCKKPIESVDSYLYGKVDSLEHSFPVISKPTDQLARNIYDLTLKQPIDSFNNFKGDITTYSTDKLNSIRSFGCDQISKSAELGVSVVEACLENRFSKLITLPILDYTERQLDYWIPTEKSDANGHMIVVDDSCAPRTLRRIYNINNRLYNHLYQTTFNQLNRIHDRFESVISKLEVLKQIMQMGYEEAKDRIVTTLQSTSQLSLVSQCMNVINKRNISLERLEMMARNNYKLIINEVYQMIDRYMALVKNFPVVANGTKLKQTIDNFTAQLKMESFSPYLNNTIEQLRNMHLALISYTNQMFQVVNNLKPMNLLNSKPNGIKSETNAHQSDQHANNTNDSKSE